MSAEVRRTFWSVMQDGNVDEPFDSEGVFHRDVQSAFADRDEWRRDVDEGADGIEVVRIDATIQVVDRPDVMSVNGTLDKIDAMTAEEGILSIKGHGFGPEVHLTLSWDRFGHGIATIKPTLAEAIDELYVEWLDAFRQLEAGAFQSTAPDLDDPSNWRYPHEYVAKVEADRDLAQAQVERLGSLVRVTGVYYDIDPGAIEDMIVAAMKVDGPLLIDHHAPKREGTV